MIRGREIAGVQIENCALTRAQLTTPKRGEKSGHYFAHNVLMLGDTECTVWPSPGGCWAPWREGTPVRAQLVSVEPGAGVGAPPADSASGPAHPTHRA